MPTPPPPPSTASRMTVCVLASGSRGNCIYVAGGGTAVLIDAGLSGRELERRMRVRDLSPEDLDAILVTHEHGDHLQGVGVLARRYKLPVYVNRATLAAADRIGRLPVAHHFDCGRPFRLQALTVHPFSISHDAADPAAFTISANGTKVGMATDLGVATGVVREHLRGCRLLVLEANHDPGMLMDGPYPWPLKQRISGRTGHLSNPDAVRLLRDLLHAGLRHVILAHLSETNNTPETARAAAAGALSGFPEVRLEIAGPDVPGLPVHL